VAAVVGSLETNAASGWNIPQRAGKWMKRAARGCRNKAFGNNSSQWLEYPAEGGKMDETRSQWLWK